MTVNRGKDFEDIIRDELAKVVNVYSMRIYDTMNIYGISNTCDVIAHKKPILYLFECKSCHNASLPLSNITDTQWAGLLNASLYDGVRAGYLIWFIDKQVTYYVSADNMNKYLQKYHTKSFNYEQLKEYAITLKARQKRVYCEYDMLDLFERMEEYYENR